MPKVAWKHGCKYTVSTTHCACLATKGEASILVLLVPQLRILDYKPPSPTAFFLKAHAQRTLSMTSSSSKDEEVVISD
eukprot:5404117-Amphidinium_carterae.1